MRRAVTVVLAAIIFLGLASQGPSLPVTIASFQAISTAATATPIKWTIDASGSTQTFCPSGYRPVASIKAGAGQPAIVTCKVNTSVTATLTALPTATTSPTGVPTSTPTPSSTATASSTATFTATASASATVSPTATLTILPTLIPTETPSLSPTDTATSLPTATITDTVTATPTDTNTVTSTATLGATSTATPTATVTPLPPTVTPTVTFGTPTSHELVTNQGSAQLNLVHTIDLDPIGGTQTPVAIITQVIALGAQATFAIDAQTAIPNGFNGYDHLTGDQPFTAVNQ